MPSRFERALVAALGAVAVVALTVSASSGTASLSHPRRPRVFAEELGADGQDLFTDLKEEVGDRFADEELVDFFATIHEADPTTAVVDKGGEYQLPRELTGEQVNALKANAWKYARPPEPKEVPENEDNVRSLSAQNIVRVVHGVNLTEQDASEYDSILEDLRSLEQITDQERAEEISATAMERVNNQGSSADRLTAALFGEALKLSPQSPVSEINFGVALMRLGLLERARHHLQKAVDTDPRNGNAQFNFRYVSKLLHMRSLLKQTRSNLAKQLRERGRVDRRPVKPFARIKLSDLYKPENTEYLHGAKAFILTEAFSPEQVADMQRRSEAIIAYFGNKVYTEWSPFGTEPTRSLPRAVMKLRELMRILEYSRGMPFPEARKYTNVTDFGQSSIWSPSWRDWYSVERFLGLDRAKNLPNLFRDDNHWLAPGACFRTMRARGSFEDATRWRLITIGSHMAGMHLHEDWLKVGSWQLQLLGAKTWFICPRSEGPLVESGEATDGHSVNTTNSPLFSQARCFNGTLYPGEFIYYPQGYWHQTLYQTQPEYGTMPSPSKPPEYSMPWNLEPFSFAISSTVVNPESVEAFIGQLQSDCAKEGTDEESESNFRISPSSTGFCQEVLVRCARWLRQGHEGYWAAKPKNAMGKDWVENPDAQPFFVSPDVDGNDPEEGEIAAAAAAGVCTRDDTVQVAREVRRDMEAYTKIRAIVDDLHDVYDELHRVYGEDTRV